MARQNIIAIGELYMPSLGIQQLVYLYKRVTCKATPLYKNKAAEARQKSQQQRRQPEGGTYS